MSLFNRFQTQCKTHLPETQNYLIGLSGGVDSVVLLHLFSRTDFKVRAIYIHHGLSPNADNWATFCKQYCKRLNIPFILQKVKVDKSDSIENGARKARYQAIGRHIQTNEVFTTAHHLDDQVETFFLALKRGSGIKGLSAMQPLNTLQHFTIFRPLLTLSKADLLTYANQHQLDWIEDESNTDNLFDRNFLRNEVIPKLNDRWQQFSRMVMRSAQHCAEQQALIEELLNDELTQRTKENKQFSIHHFEALSTTKQQQLIRLWLEKNGLMMPTLAQLQAIISELIFAKKDKNPQIKIGEKIIQRYQQTLFITENIVDLPSVEITLSPETKVELPYQLGMIIRRQQEIICKKNEKNNRLLLPIELAEQTVILKIGQKGKIKLYGKPYHEEMKKIWQKNNVPVWERNRTPLIFWQDQLIACLT